MSSARDRKFFPDIQLDKTGGVHLKEHVEKYLDSSKEKFEAMNRQLNKVSTKFNLLHNLADEVATKYEKIARTRESSNPEETKLLQIIVDQSLSKKDINLFCCYIVRMFNIIFKNIQDASPRFTSIKTVFRLHQLKTNDRELSLTYDTIANQLGVTNNGHRSSDIYQLYKFLKDFDHINGKRIFPQKINPVQKKTESSKIIEKYDENNFLAYSFERRNELNMEYSEMPLTDDLLDRNLIAYALAKIKDGVQNCLLNNALVNCVRAVQLSKALLSQ